jgi:SAM-dependent methyltransferase
MEQISEAFRVLGDSTRLRIMRLIGQARLNASELVSLIGIAQSSVSHHLAKLKALSLVREERVGTFTYYSLAIEQGDQWWPFFEMAKLSKDEHGDNTRLVELLQQREDAQALNEKLLEPGQSWRLWASALASLVPPMDVADFGCGSGAMTFELCRFAKHVTAVDENKNVLLKAKNNAAQLRIDNVTFLEANLEHLPLRQASYDLVVVSQSLHHVSAPRLALSEAARILRPGGKILILELEPHREEWVRRRLGHAHLGLASSDLVDCLKACGFTNTTVTPAPKISSTPFRAFMVAATRSKKRFAHPSPSSALL